MKTNNLNNQYTVDRSNPEDLRVLVLPEADINRLKSLIADEINDWSSCAGFTKEALRRSKHDTEYTKFLKIAINKSKQRIKNLAKLQHAMKHEVCHASVLRDLLSGE